MNINRKVSAFQPIDIEHSTIDWLKTHHRLKQNERRRAVEQLDIRPGERVLDMGCGPGLWTDLFCERVGKDGAVVGLDMNAEFISYAAAESEAKLPGFDVSYICSSYHEIPDELGTFDVIFCSQCLCYEEHPLKLLSVIKPRLKPGGRIIGRNWDGGTFIVHPIDETLVMRVQEALASVLESSDRPYFIDNYVGRKMPGLFKEAGFANISVLPEMFARTGPASPELVQYVSSNAHWMADTGKKALSATDFERWMHLFDPQNTDSIYTRDDFFFAVNEVTVTGYL